MQTLGLIPNTIWTGSGGTLQGKMRTSIVISLNDISNVFYPFSVRAFSRPECSVRWSFLVLGIQSPHPCTPSLSPWTVLSGTAFLSFVPHLLSFPFVLTNQLFTLTHSASLLIISCALWLKVQNTCVAVIVEAIYDNVHYGACLFLLWKRQKITTYSLLLTTHT